MEGIRGPALARRNSQQQFIQHQREKQARQQALLDRQNLNQLQRDQVEQQNLMLIDVKQPNASASAQGVSPRLVGQDRADIAGHAPDQLTKANETFSNYHASLVANQRAQLTQNSPILDLGQSPEPIPDGSRYVLREPLGPHVQRSRDTGEERPGLHRTLSQPSIRIPASSPKDHLMPPPATSNPSMPPNQGRPPLVRSASSSLVEDEQNIVDRLEEQPSNLAKRRRDSASLNSPIELREMKKARSGLDLGAQIKTSTPILRSPLATETDFSIASPPPPPSSTVHEEAVTPGCNQKQPIDTNLPNRSSCSLDATETHLVSLEENPENNTALSFAEVDELEAPTMTDAELDAFFAQSVKAIDGPTDVLSSITDEAKVQAAPISIPDTAEFDFSDYDTLFGSGAASYDPTTYDLRV